MTRLLLLLALPALSLAYYADYDSWLVQVSDDVGPGCVDGIQEYPGVPTDITPCPEVDPPDPVISPNSHDCSSYVLCVNGTAGVVCCPAGQLYDPPMVTCDDPPHVDCGLRPILHHKSTTTTSTTTTTTTTTTTMTPPPPDVIPEKCSSIPLIPHVNLPMEESCFTYYECDYGAAIVTECPKDGDEQMVFNPVTQDCDYPWHYPCEDHMSH